MSPIPLSVQLAEKLSTISIATASREEVSLVVQAFVDTIGCILIGRQYPSVRTVSKIFGQPPGKSLIIGAGSQRTTDLDATVINGVASHVVDYDDMVDGSHPSVTLVPVILALAEELDSPGEDILNAYIAGFETHQRLLRVLFPHHYNNGWHPTATMGTFAAASACASLLKFDITQTATTLSVAASMASGIKANIGTMVKSYHVGQCGRNGLLAATLVKNGFDANLTALEHPAGFFHAYDGLDNVDPTRLLSDWPRGLAIARGPWSLKPYPCCGSTHTAIRVAFKLRKEHNLDLSRIQSILVTVHEDRIPHTNRPFPKSALDSKFSIQYSTARALASGNVRLAHFEGTAYLEDTIQQLLGKITVQARPQSKNRDISEICAGSILLTMDDGKELFAELPGFLGPGSTAPFTEAELWEKFSDCTRLGLDEKVSRLLFDELLKLPQQRSLKDILLLLEQANLA
ncbi:hypothetical protein M409DRAFT_54745 [Zasmidium cellare ATCC 36951]|uniref:MmgE/PrpD family protein n=1 Tax=Zasmidium cellare ATCC 36951 TaxID=1080233 RepID=A0A6A6CI92_ZASCE|nr:uncharacterized protein M409DRAFT_54745 [Zasmidium cellare ATCC 36951]KAF2166987.1 hypothetical protein M409DRAFT_54745 [Zasmidium cellare ATCC 36951]